MNKFEKLIFEGKYDQLLEETKEMKNLDEAYARFKVLVMIEEYKEALSRYIAALEQFKAEGVTNPDGSELKFGDDLPRAYTN